MKVYDLEVKSKEREKGEKRKVVLDVIIVNLERQKL